MGKVPVITNVAQALMRRNLEELTGLESAETKLVLTDLDCYVKTEYWVYGWVKQLWSKYSNEGYTRNFYERMKELERMNPDDRDSEIGLILLGLTDETC